MKDKDINRHLKGHFIPQETQIEEICLKSTLGLNGVVDRKNDH